MSSLRRFLLLWCFIQLNIGISEGQKKEKRWRILDETNLQTLNREIRRAFLDIVTNEITASKARFDELRPSLLDCQDKIQQVVGKCADCVDRECRNRYLECRDSASIIIPSGSGVSVSGRTDRQGRYYVTVCAVLQDNTEACQTIMNPDGVMGSSISNIGNHILVHLQGAMRDMGGVSVGGFVNGMQSFIGNYHPLNGNFSTMNETETKKMVEKMNKQYQQINSQVNEQVQQMNSRINQQVQQNSMNLRRQMNRLNQNLNQMNRRLNNNRMNLNRRLNNNRMNLNRRLNNNRMNLNRRMQNMNRNMQAWSRGFNQHMANFGTNLNRQMQTMSYNLGNMFRGTWLGRKKRSVNATTSTNSDCDLILMETNEQACLQYRQKCDGCAQHIDTTKEQTMQTVCGENLVGNMTEVKETLVEMEKLYDKVISSNDFVKKIRFDSKSGDQSSLSFSKVKVTALIGNKTETFLLGHPLKLLDLPATSAKIADKIWGKWTTNKANV